MTTGRKLAAVPGEPWLGEVPGWAGPLLAGARAAGEDAGAALALAAEYGSRLPLPGAGQTAQRWAVLAGVARQSLTAARVLEAHSDALAILAEAGEPAQPGTWGVFAAEAPGRRVEARDGVLHGVKPWCSLAGDLDYALVTAYAGEERQLLRVSMRHPSVSADSPRGWVARGLRTVTSVAVRFDGTPASPVGDPGWYLRRPGFAWGGMGVAACWHGGATGLRAAVVAAAVAGGGDLAALHAGVADAALWASAAGLASAAGSVDARAADGADGQVLGLRTRAVTAAAAEEAIRQAGHALGPAPLAFDEEHARRVADLELYVRQHHGERDLARLGRAVADAGQAPPVIRQVTVVIPAADEEERIAACLAAVRVAVRRLADCAGIAARVIVALDGCRDATAAVCASFPGVGMVAVTGRCAGAARRAAATAALGQWAGRAGELWLASTDADSRVPADWLAVMADEARRGADLVLGTVLPGPGLDPAARSRWLARHHLRDGHPHVHGANLGIRASAYIALGGWPPLAAGEDAALARRAAGAGWPQVTRTAAIPVVSSARRRGRAPGGFASYLRELSAPPGDAARVGAAAPGGAAGQPAA